MTVYHSLPVSFACEGADLYGIVEVPEGLRETAVVIVVGGPQYRVGSHRQFVLLARSLARAGVASIRFDYRGIGDSAGETTFENLDADLTVAIDALQTHLPSVRRVVLWGLCDAASAILMYAYKDPRIEGVVLLNPWVRSESSLAQTYVKHYYGSQLLSAALWKRLFAGDVNPFRALGGFYDAVRSVVGSWLGGRSPGGEIFQDRMIVGLDRFTGRILLILSGNDITAREFREFCRQRRLDAHLQRPNTMVKSLEEANHTFSREEWRNAVSDWTRDWILSS